MFLQRNDIAMAITKFDQFDFLIDIVPRDELKPPKRQVYYIVVNDPCCMRNVVGCGRSQMRCVFVLEVSTSHTFCDDGCRGVNVLGARTAEIHCKGQLVTNMCPFSQTLAFDDGAPFCYCSSISCIMKGFYNF